MTIHKATFLAAIPCGTQGWYASRIDPEPITPGLAWRFFTGQEIGRIAREQLGTGPMMPRAPEEMAVAATTRAMSEAANRLIYECTFVSGGFVARADALRRNAGGWDIIEVKSGKAPEEKVTKKGVQEGAPKEEYLQDLAYTVFVAKASGISLGRCILMLISRDFQYGNGADILVEVDVTQAVMALAETFATMSVEVAAAINAVERPEPVLKFACRDCSYFELQCIGKDIPDPLFDLPRLSEKRFDAIKSHVRISALPAGLDLTPSQQRVVAVLQGGRPIEAREGLETLDELEWPAHYLDFESVSPALPWFEGSGPYDAIPFQFSLHVRATPSHPLTHREYLAPIGRDWRRELVETLLPALGTVGSVLMYSSYEKRMFSYLADSFPDLREQIEAVILRLFDLEAVVKDGYCHPGFRGRTSIKFVLPAMVKDLAYEGLTIRGGDDAAGAFALMYVNQTKSDRHDGERAALLAYCKLDTLAMVRVHEELAKIREKHR